MPRSGSKRSAAPTSATMPTWVRSSSGSPRSAYRRASASTKPTWSRISCSRSRERAGAVAEGPGLTSPGLPSPAEGETRSRAAVTSGPRAGRLAHLLTGTASPTSPPGGKPLHEETDSCRCSASTRSSTTRPPRSSSTASRSRRRRRSASAAASTASRRCRSPRGSCRSSRRAWCLEHGGHPAGGPRRRRLLLRPRPGDAAGRRPHRGRLGGAADALRAAGAAVPAAALPGLDPERVRFVPHHVAHAASAYLAAPLPTTAR